LEFYFVGKRAADAFTKRGFKGEYFSDVWTGKFTTTKSDKLASLLTQKFLSGEVATVLVAHTQFKTVLSQIVSKKQLLPLEITASSTGKNEENVSKQFLYEPERKALLASLLPGMVRTNMYKMLADSLASEYGARMTAMDNATRNAGQMISRLTLEANRVRQASITKELMEIVGGAEALKG
jgi:F-type H+-transporting ATPase subunit gamma